MMDNRAAWYVVFWRLIWVLPVMASRILFCLMVLIGWGQDKAYDAWRSTR